MSDKNKKVVVIACVIISSIVLFAINIYLAYKSPERNTNVYTAISGWVGFLATATIGVITILQSADYSRKSKKNSEETSKSIIEMQRLVNSINDSIWRSNIPVITLSFENVKFYTQTDIILSIYGKDVGQIKREDNICFRVHNIACNNNSWTGRYRCRLCIKFIIKNDSDTPILDVSCTELLLKYKNECTEYRDTGSFLQGYIPARDETECCVYFLGEQVVISNDINCFEMILKLGITDSRGYKQSKKFQLFVANQNAEDEEKLFTPRVIYSDIEKT